MHKTSFLTNIVDAKETTNMNTFAKVVELISENPLSNTVPGTETAQHFENETKNNSEHGDVVGTEAKTENKTNFKEGKTSEMTFTNGNIMKVEGVNKLSVSVRDSTGNVRKRALETGLSDLCKTAKVIEENGAFGQSALYDKLREGKQENDLDAIKKYKLECVSSVLHNNPFGRIYTSCNSNTNASDDVVGKYCHQKNIESCNVCKMHTLQMHKGCDSFRSSHENVLQKRGQTEEEIAEIIKGISLLKLCSNLKKIHQMNRDMCKMRISKGLPPFPVETHCSANTGIVFPSMTKYRNKNTFRSRCCASTETCSINKFMVDDNDRNPSFSLRKKNEKIIGTLKHFRCEVDVRKTSTNPGNDVEEEERHAMNVINTHVEDKMSDTSTIKNFDASDLDKSDEDDEMHITSSVKDMDASDLMDKSDEDEEMHITRSVKDTDATDLMEKSDEDEAMHITSSVKDMDASDLMDKSDEDEEMHITRSVKDIDATDLMGKSDEDEAMHITSSVKDIDATDLMEKRDKDDAMHVASSVKDIDASDSMDKSDEDEMMHVGSTISEMDASYLTCESDNENDDGMSVVSSVKHMDICEISNKIIQNNVSDLRNTNVMYRREDRRKEKNYKIDVSDVDNLVSLVNDYVSIRDVFHPELNQDTCDNLSMADETNDSSMILGDAKDIKDFDTSDQEDEMLSVMSAVTFEDDSSICSMKEVMSVVELTDIHRYRHVETRSDSDSDTLRDGSESSDDLSASYEGTSITTSLDETITSDYIDEDVDDSSRSGDYDENVEEETSDDDDNIDDLDCESVSCSEFDTCNCRREKDAMSCSSGPETPEDMISMTNNDDDAMSGLIIH